MSFLTALASGGLSINSRAYAYRSGSDGRTEGLDDLQPKHLDPEARTEEKTNAQKVAPPLRTEAGPEERARGREEAQARLLSDACVGRLQSFCANGREAEEGMPQTGQPAEDESSFGRKLPNGEQEAASLGDHAEQTEGAAPGPASREDEDNAGFGLQQMTPEEEQQVTQLRTRDQEVKAHEQAHIAAGGGVISGGPQYEYQTGPDGKRYAVGGHVSISSGGGGGGGPDEVIADAEAVQRAANAPAQPSSQDRAVASQAAAQEAEARAEKARMKREEAQSSYPDAESGQAGQAEENDSYAPKDSDFSSGGNGISPGQKVLKTYAQRTQAFVGARPGRIAVQA